jgi:hypothetical protein
MQTLHGSVYLRRLGCTKRLHCCCVWTRSNSVCVVTTAWRTVNRVRFPAQAREFSPLCRLHCDPPSLRKMKPRAKWPGLESPHWTPSTDVLTRLKLHWSVPPLPSVHLEVLHLAQGTLLLLFLLLLLLLLFSSSLIPNSHLLHLKLQMTVSVTVAITTVFIVNSQLPPSSSQVTDDCLPLLQ